MLYIIKRYKDKQLAISFCLSISIFVIYNFTIFLTKVILARLGGVVLVREGACLKG
jgi:hypothetical protein